MLRGLPGSGKSHLAKKMKAVEVEQGGDAPRIHAIDDYFVTVRDASSDTVFTNTNDGTMLKQI